MDFTTDCHVHTRWSACADPIGIEDYVRCACELGMGHFAITDHSNDIYFDGEEAQRVKWEATQAQLETLLKLRAYRMEQYIDYIERYRDKGVRVGIELEQMPSGEFIFDWKIRDRFDVVIGAVHSIPSLKRGEGKEAVREEFLSLSLKALGHDIDILAHPTRGLRKAGIDLLPQHSDSIIDRAVSRGIALEINSHSLDPGPEFLRRCLEKGARLALNTDSHSLKEFGDFSFHRQVLEKAGLNGKALRGSCFVLK